MNKLSFLITLVVILFYSSATFAQSSAFTYQGRLTDSSMPPTGQYDFTFAVYQNMAASMPLATSSVDDVQVSNGVFTVNLDFGSTIFRDNPEAVLEIRVRPGASTDTHTTLTPRLPFTSTPRAVTSLNANTATTANFATNAANATNATNAANADTIDGQDSTSFFSLGDNEIVTGTPSFNGGTSGSTAPFAVDSTAVVSNLNADFLDGLSSSSFIQTTGGLISGGGLTVDNTFAGAGNGIGVRGLAGSIGVYGYANAFSFSGNAFGVYAGVQGSAGTRFGLYADAVVFPGTQTAYGVYGVASGATTNFAGYFQGNAQVTGILSKGGGAFKIDHPLDPANKYLQHSFVESPDMMNIYNGNVTTDGSGNAVITLPEWFESLNKDFRYQLTVIGQFAQAIVSEKIKDNRFAVKTDKPGVEVSWQVTGIRKDKFAEDNRIKVEEDKIPADRGKCLYAPLCGGAVIDPGADARKESESRKLQEEEG
jgi:hypothetical protein